MTSSTDNPQLKGPLLRTYGARFFEAKKKRFIAETRISRHFPVSADVLPHHDLSCSSFLPSSSQMCAARRGFLILFTPMEGNWEAPVFAEKAMSAVGYFRVFTSSL